MGGSGLRGRGQERGSSPSYNYFATELDAETSLSKVFNKGRGGITSILRRSLGFCTRRGGLEVNPFIVYVLPRRKSAPPCSELSGARGERMPPLRTAS
ncbi:hypothetical protein INR49_029223 [Caranx melampygus]|nr:hypothetical protein INR49_029223 [Caranx melampygus]